MSQFNEICFWSDSGLHFYSTKLMHFIFNYLSSIYNKKFIFNYFIEYYSKNIIDSHFDILSRWFIKGKAIQYIYTIKGLINYFKNKHNFIIIIHLKFIHI